MNIAHKLAACCLLLIFITTGSLQAQENSPQEMQKSCQNFVQGFYDKFVRAQKTQKPARDHLNPALSPELRQLLKEDYEAYENDLASLDFAPIADGNEVADRYEVGEVIRKGDRYLVEVYKIWGKKRDQEDVMKHEVMSTRGSWMIMNIHYYNYRKGKLIAHFDLLTILKGLREQRRKESR